MAGFTGTFECCNRSLAFILSKREKCDTYSLWSPLLVFGKDREKKKKEQRKKEKERGKKKKRRRKRIRKETNHIKRENRYNVP